MSIDSTVISNQPNATTLVNDKPTVLLEAKDNVLSGNMTDTMAHIAARLLPNLFKTVGEKKNIFGEAPHTNSVVSNPDALGGMGKLNKLPQSIFGGPK
ncbi:MAG: hypothetical protein LBB09_00640 [Rickettsiales bacterium]|jgi:hypothetical protein|nr:hypothetical protein [Rickettsiales bacterium]